ncbi:hypothetical protein N0824_02088 [Microcystis sp. 0824]|nr:hypothetical protein [Microcystis sp. 0824]GBF54226.1 hypothetical protein N0824_02088 [Microcystis sp. 0824]
MNYEVIIPKPVQKQLKIFPNDVQNRLKEKSLYIDPQKVKKW